ncbi:hypothetical protein L1987_18252 [Smallanthus sonchifolius]|uniref:Uncharacterized protein n=1 Tax=Smallanthus sonchifolius TaxID=185202 RepID=A0ACB9J1E8_9ASTR|nr:hypothetical protein L1987_18252 [Smallanthus sonchifolius]
MYILIGDSSDSCKTVGIASSWCSYSTMWIFMLVMMVLTRTRSDEDSRVPTTESVVEGNASATTTRTTRRRKRGSDDTRSAEQPAAIEQLGTKQPAIEPPATEQHVDPPKRRGRTMKTILYEKLEGKFQLLRTNKAFMKYVDGRLHAQWVRTRGALSRHWKENGGKTDPQRARLQLHSNCRSQDDWNHLCDYWELEKTRKYNDNMEANRAKQVMISRGGSRSIANHAYKMV